MSAGHRGRRVVAVGIVTAAIVLGRPMPARAAIGVDSVGESILYGGTSVAAAFTTLGNGVGIAFGAPVDRGWRIAGGITGAAGMTLGTLMLVDRHGTTTSVAVGGIPLFFGVTSIATALLVDDESSIPTVVPLITPEGAVAGASWVCSF